MTSQNSPPLETIGNYDLLEKVGDGSMGAVYKARHWETKAIVAIKVMLPQVASNPVLLKRFEQEFRIASKLDHPNIVKVMEFCGTGGQPYIVMELVEGESLGDKLHREGKMAEDEAIRVIVQVAHGLHRAHRQGLIHRDVKPDNILVTPDGKAKLTDLGLAKDSDANADLTRTGRGLGTPDYMAPEQFRNAKNASVRCDIYGLGATLYHMVTGTIPFDEDEPIKAMMRKLKNELPNPRTVVRDITERTDWAIRRAMSANPDNRPASCREFAEDLLGQSTRGGSNADIDANVESGTWYIVFTDPEGMVRTAKGTTKAMRRAIKEGQLGDPDKVRGSQCKTGPFELLYTFLEFRDLVVAPAPGPPLSEMSMVNISKMTRPGASGNNAPARTVPVAPAEEEAAPHFQLPGKSEETAPSRWADLVKLVVLVVVTLITTMVAARYIMPLLK
ncbi:MAG: serine/threonine protein kinase [Gemmataceae bacterium]|nr:serine/threonine protein kinase [Gemmataceae bacterium]